MVLELSPGLNHEKVINFWSESPGIPPPRNKKNPGTGTKTATLLKIEINTFA